VPRAPAIVGIRSRLALAVAWHLTPDDLRRLILAHSFERWMSDPAASGLGTATNGEESAAMRWSFAMIDRPSGMLRRVPTLPA
jgi:hypothetical protein